MKEKKGFNKMFQKKGLKYKKKRMIWSPGGKKVFNDGGKRERDDSEV